MFLPLLPLRSTFNRPQRCSEAVLARIPPFRRPIGIHDDNGDGAIDDNVDKDGNGDDATDDDGTTMARRMTMTTMATTATAWRRTTTTSTTMTTTTCRCALERGMIVATRRSRRRRGRSQILWGYTQQSNRSWGGGVVDGDA